jgi:protein phosphatase
MVVPILALLLVVAFFAAIAWFVLRPKAPAVQEAPPRASAAEELPGSVNHQPVAPPKAVVPVGAIEFELPMATHDPELGVPPSSSHKASPAVLTLDAPAPPPRSLSPAPGSFGAAPQVTDLHALFEPPPRASTRPMTLEAPAPNRPIEAPLSLPQSPRPRDPSHPVVTTAASMPSSILEMPTPIAPPVAMVDPNATARVQAVVPSNAFPPAFDDPRNDRGGEDDDEGYAGGIPDEFIAKLCDAGADDEPREGPPAFRVIACANTDRGRRRKRNEDSVNLMEDLTCYAVADGMGGHKGGAEASQMATETLETVFRQQGKSLSGAVPEIPSRSATVAIGIAKANAAIFQRAQNDPTLAKMGTTIVVTHFVPEIGRLYLGHVGDSRCYRLRKGHLERLTQDHTMAEFGLTGPMSGNLSRAVGISPTVKVDVICGKPEDGDVYLLCSDGLTKMLEDALIHDALDSFGATPEYAVDELVALANARGGRDNVTVVVAYVSAA